MSSLVESRRKRWQMEATRAHGRDLPVWTREDADEDTTTSKRRLMRRRSERVTVPEVKISLITKERRRRSFEIPGGSFREADDDRRVRRNKDDDEDYDMPGNSLRESTADGDAATATSTKASRRTTTIETVDATATETATKTASGTSSAVAHTTTHYASHGSASSDSDSDGYESASASEAETDVPTGNTIASAAPAVTSSISASDNLMVEDNVHSNVHKILLSVGCVVGFILIASVLLIAWKLRKRNHRPKTKGPLDDVTFQKPSRIDRILSKAPFLRAHLTNRHEWYTIPEPSRITVEKSRATPTPRLTTRRIDSTLSFDKPVGLGLYGADFSQSVSTIDTSFIAPGKPTNVYTGTLPRAQSSNFVIATPAPVSPLEVHDPLPQEPLPRTTPASQTPAARTPAARSRVNSVVTSPVLERVTTARSRANSVAVSPTSTMFVEDTAVEVQVLSRQAPRAIRLSGGKKEEEEIPPMPTPKWNFSHLKRQTGASDLSSISSGFGDGDIIITSNNTVTTVNGQRLPTPTSPVAEVSASSRQSSLSSHRTNTGSSLRHESRRDTASTQVSIEARPRFHSVNSWVKQQSGQVRRAQQSSGDTPPVPMLPPPEQELRYMMPDGEEPRRPEAL